MRESLARLGGRQADGTPFFDAHHVAAAERLEKLTSRALMTPRLTMSYGPRITGGAAGNTAAELTDGAAHARDRLNALARQLPPDCWSTLLDVCCFGKGLQDIEAERRWPRRSAKLVLRIGLDQLAQIFGLAPHRARETAAVTGWTTGRLPLIADRDLNQSRSVHEP